MTWLLGAQNAIVLALGVGALACGLFAFVDALRHDKGAYSVEGKQSKTFWLVLLGVAVALLFVSVQNVLSLFGLLAIVAVGVYLADVRPALSPYTARKNKKGASGSGPYGSW